MSVITRMGYPFGKASVLRAAAAQGKRAMVYWARGSISDDAPLPDTLKEQFAHFALTRDLGPRAWKALATEAQWFSLPGGTVLPRDGDNDMAVFLVTAGSLGIYTTDERDRDLYVATIPAGETVGEMSLISGEPHSAKIVALRDTQMLRLPKSAFERLIARHPRLALNLMRMLVRRLRHTTRRAIGTNRARTLALIPLTPGADCYRLAQALSRALSGLSLSNMVAGPDSVSRSTEWFQTLENHHDMVLYVGDQPESPWTQLCLRQADRVLMVARSGEPVPMHPLSQEPEGRLKRQMPELIILNGGNGQHGHPAPDSVMSFSLHHHVNPDSAKDTARLARMLTGRAVGLVLAGGGARGFAHIGAIRALSEAGVPFDMAGGASMGAIVAACVAMGWNHRDIHDQMRRSFVDINPLSDYTLPLISVFRGQKVTQLLKHNFGDMRIEDMPLPFYCVSSNLSGGRTRTHQTGLLWRALRASVAIPGLLPPVVEEGQMLVDGGLMNNFPVDIMAGLGRGPIIGIDVAGDENFSTMQEDFEGRSWWRLLREQMNGAPSIVSILMRSGTVGNETQRREARAQTDFLLEPPMPGVSLRSWKAFDQAVEAGYAHTAEMIERDGLDFMWAVRALG